MEEQWRTINEISKELEIPETTARRYLVTFKEYLLNHAQEYGRVKKYPEHSMKVIGLAYKMYQAGKSTDEIKAVFEKEFKSIIEVTPESINSDPEETLSIIPQQATKELALQNKELQDIVRNNTTAMNQLTETIAKLLERQDVLYERLVSGEETIRQLQEELSEFKNKPKPSLLQRIFRGKDK